MEHTKEPWEVGADKPPFYAGETVIIGQKEGQPFILAQCNHNFDNLSKANARRIVACVNALKGIDTNFLEGLNRDQMTIVTSEAFEYWEKKADEVIALTTDRDQLQKKLSRSENLIDLFTRNLSEMTADRDRWKALAGEAKHKASYLRMLINLGRIDDSGILCKLDEITIMIQEAGE